MIRLIDDGTLDTVFECNVCWATFRLNYANSGTELCYDDWVEAVIDSRIVECVSCNSAPDRRTLV